jgi:hypothetical protein
MERNGPAVSSGMTAQSAAAAADPLAPDDVPLAVGVGDDEPLADGSQATIDISPALIVVRPASLRTWRRSIRVERS